MTTPSHDNLVFSDKQSSISRDLNNVVGRYNDGEIVFLDDNQQGTKWKALHNAGFQIHLAKDKNNNWYITDMIDNLSKVNPYTESEKDTEYVDVSEFLKNHSDGAIDIMFTTPELKNFHRVGLINLEDNVYTLTPDLVDKLSSFDYEINEDEEIYANVLTDSVLHLIYCSLKDTSKQTTKISMNQSRYLNYLLLKR